MRQMTGTLEVKPEVALLEELFDQIELGQLRVPRFQRPYVWPPRQMRELFDSIERGFPVGTLLLWEPDEPVPSLDSMGALPLPEPSARRVAYLLDGHQRLATLFSTLRLPEDFPRSERQKDWMWWIYRDLSSADSGKKNGYVHVQSGDPPPHYLPLRAAMRTMDFLAFARKLTAAAKNTELPQAGSVDGPSMSRPGYASESPELGTVDGQIAHAEWLANRLKSYKLATIRIRGGTVDEAVEIFSRLNSEGQRMTPEQMVSALTYPKAGSDFTVGEEIERIGKNIIEQGFGPVPRDAVFRTILAASGQADILRADWSKLADAVGQDMRNSVESAEAGLSAAIELLRSDVGVCHARLLPYSTQLVLLAAFFIKEPTPSAEQRGELVRWFWMTSFSGWFAGANSTQVKEALEWMKLFADGQRESLAALFTKKARPYPTSFDLRSARVRALLLWQLEAKPMDASGAIIDCARELATHDVRAYRYVLHSRQLRGTAGVSNPANRILMPPAAKKSMRQTLLELSDDLRDPVLASHHISPEAFAALRDGADERFIELRAQRMAEGERMLLTKLGIPLPSELSDETDIDTDDSGVV